MKKIQKTKLQDRFKLGVLVLTRGVADKVAENTHFAEFVWDSIKRHARGDWGDISKEDWKENQFSLDRRLRLFSVYKQKKTKIWIITEADRSVTTVLFPEEY